MTFFFVYIIDYLFIYLLKMMLIELNLKIKVNSKF